MLSILDLLTGIFDTLTGLDAIAAAGAGWRYIFSSEYRARTHTRWRHSSQLRITTDILGALLCMAGSLFVLALLGSYVFGWGWFRAIPHSP